MRSLKSNQYEQKSPDNEYIEYTDHEIDISKNVPAQGKITNTFESSYNTSHNIKDNPKQIHILKKEHVVSSHTITKKLYLIHT